MFYIEEQVLVLQAGGEASQAEGLRREGRLFGHGEL